MNNRIKAIFFDIDGTLVSFKTHKVPQETKDAIIQLRKQGIKVFVATGRMLPMVKVLDDIEFDGYVAALFYVSIGAIELALALYIFYLMYNKKQTSNIDKYGEL
jgi:HAD superfamily hydrolase (TIGR01484 family)